MRREFLMLAHTMDQITDQIIIPFSRTYMSIKMDGQRAFWDGGVTRGWAKKKVPWANCMKDERYKEEQVSTGLWSRYGNVIHAPSEWLDQLPVGILLDGELWAGRNTFQAMRSIVSRLDGSIHDWNGVQYHVFDSPGTHTFGTIGQIKNNNQKTQITSSTMQVLSGLRPTSLLIEMLDKVLDKYYNNIVVHVPQTKVTTTKEIISALDEETDRNGEGIMLRCGDSIWVPYRSKKLLKLKKFFDDEGIITGFNPGEGKYTGKVGSLIVSRKGVSNKDVSSKDVSSKDVSSKDVSSKDVSFNLSGMTDEEREPGYFKIGEIVRFRYRTLTADGLPREARYWR